MLLSCCFPLNFCISSGAKRNLKNLYLDPRWPPAAATSDGHLSDLWERVWAGPGLVPLLRQIPTLLHNKQRDQGGITQTDPKVNQEDGRAKQRYCCRAI